jgi:hypothetical protein
MDMWVYCLIPANEWRMDPNSKSRIQQDNARDNSEVQDPFTLDNVAGLEAIVLRSWKDLSFYCHFPNLKLLVWFSSIYLEASLDNAPKNFLTSLKRSRWPV